MPSALHKQLIRLDAAMAYVRHITDVKAEDFNAQVDVLDASSPLGDVGHLDGMTSATLPIPTPSYSNAGRQTETRMRVEDTGDDDEHG